MSDAVLVAAALHVIAGELHLIRLTLFALCPDSDKEVLTEMLELVAAEQTKGLKEVASCLKS